MLLNKAGPQPPGRSRRRLRLVLLAAMTSVTLPLAGLAFGTAASAASTTATSHVTGGTAGTSGSVHSPQPFSNADMNAGGANTGGTCTGQPANQYCSTRSGLPSGNGNGNGNATGKPCAGCVGKADNKNPPGQFPNGSDHNAGYECDSNHGIGQTNPAHTGCKTPPPPPTCVPTEANHQCGSPPPGCVPTAANNQCQPPCVPSESNNNCGSPPPGCVPTAANSFCSSVLGGNTSSGSTSGGSTGSGSTSKTAVAGTTTTAVAGTTTTKALLPTKVLGETFTASPAAGKAHALPFTGFNALAGLGLALTLLGGGVALLGASRLRLRRSTS